MFSSRASWLRGGVGSRGRVVAGGLAMVLGLAACQPGWVSPYAGSGSSGTTGDAGPAVAAELQTPNSVVAIPGGGFYVADSDACVIRKIDASGVITTVAGTASTSSSFTCGDTGDDGPATAATIWPEVHGRNIGAGLWLDSAGNLYFANAAPSDQSGWVVRRITSAGVISTITAPDAHLQSLAVAADGTVYASQIFFNDAGDFGTTDVVAYDSAGNQIGSWPTGTDTLSIAIIDSSTLALASYHGGVSRLDLASGVVTPAATISTTDFSGPIAAASDGTIYIGASNTVWRVGTDNGVTAIAGGPFNGADPATSAQPGPGTGLQLSPIALAVTPHNGLLISSGHVVYRLDHPATAPG